MAYQPKSYKKFVATAATATLVASAIVPVASANGASTAAFTDVSAKYQVAVDYLVDNNITVGLTETSFGIDSTIKRGDAAIMLAKALGIVDDSNAAPSGFTDVPARAALAINSLKAAGIINGKTTTSFGFEDNLTRGEVALIMANVKAYDLKGDTSSLKFTDVSSRYASAVAGFVEAGITSGKTATTFGTGDAIKRGDFAIFVYKAETLVPATPEVVSVSAINAKELEIKFNQPVKEASVIDTGDVKAGVFKINTVEANGLTSSASLSADGKTLTLVATGTWSGSNSVESIANTVETLAGEKVEVYKGFFTASDTLRPSIVGTTYIDKYTYEVNFSEPVSAATANFLHEDGTALAAAPTTSLVNGNKSLRVVFAPTTAVNKNIVISFADLTDYAANVSVPTSTKVVISDADKAAPTVSSVATTGYNGTNTTFDIKLSEVIAEATVNTITVNGTATTAVRDASDKSLLHVTVAGKVTGNALVYVPANSYTDLSGNKNTELGQFYAFATDSTVPVVTGSAVERVNGTEYLVVSYNENVTVDTTKSLVFSYTDAFGMPVSFTDANIAGDVSLHNVDANGKSNKVKINLSTVTDGTSTLVNDKSYKVALPAGFAVDAFNNVSVASEAAFNTTTIVSGTGSTLTVAGIAEVAGKPGTIAVTFNRAVDLASAQNVANYVVEGATVSSATVTANTATSATVELVLAEGTVEVGGTYNVTVKPIKPFNNLDTTNVETTTPEVLSENVRATLTGSVVTNFTADTFDAKLTFNDASLVDGVAADFELYVNGVATGEKFTAGTFTNGVVTVSWSDATDPIAVADLTTATSVKLVAVSTLDIKDTAGNKAKVSEIVIK